MKKVGTILTAMTVAALIVGSSTAANADTLGWAEDGLGMTASTMAAKAAVSHRGEAETKVINGTTHKRAHGWTTWVGVYHYTRARLENGSTINGDSGRVWGTSGTEAVSPYKAYTASSGPGSAKTYYGK